MNPLIPKTLRLFSRSTLNSIVSQTRTFKSKLQYPHYQYHRAPLTTTALRKMAETNNQDLLLSSLFDVKGKVALVTGGGTVPISQNPCTS